MYCVAVVSALNFINKKSDRGIIDESIATKLTEALEGDKDHSVRAQLRTEPADAVLLREVKELLNN